MPRRLLVRQAAIMLAVTAVFVIPWTIRNAIEMHAFIPLSTNFSSTFWSGHNPNAYGGPDYAPASLVNQATAPVSKPKHELELETLLRDRALSWMAAHPADELRLVPLKLVAFFSGDGQAIPLWIEKSVAPGHPVLSKHASYRLQILANVTGDAVIVLFVVALVTMGRALWRQSLLLRGSLVYFAISIVLYGFVFYGNFRYRSTLEPLMLMVAAPMLVRLWALRNERLPNAA
jgi:hypothetical protein